MTKSIITISREYGSGGRFIGKKLADKLNIPFYDNELIIMAAKKSGYAESIFENAEKTSAHSLLYSLSMFGTSSGVYGLPLSDKVFIIQSEIIRKLADEGPCVIIGRCADYVLNEYNNVINVFITSTDENKIKRAVSYYNLNEENALSNIQKINKKRAAYYGYYTGEIWGNAQNYDLSINSDSIGIDNAVEMIEKFIHLKDLMI